MTWIYRDHRQWAREFHEKRQRAEGFQKGYVVPTPLWQLVKMAFLPPDGKVLARGGWFYEDLRTYAQRLRDIIVQNVNEVGWDVIRMVLLFARRYALVKDTAIIGALFAPVDIAASLLLEFPPNQVLKYVDVARKARWFAGGFGSQKKAVVRKVLYEWANDERKLQYYAVRYRDDMRHLLKVTHPKPPNSIAEQVWGWVVGRREPPTEYIRAADAIMRRSARGVEAAQLALQHRLPIEIVRSNIGFEELPGDLVVEMFKRLASPIGAYMQLSTVYEKAGLDGALEVARHFAGRVPLAYGFKAVFGLWKQGRQDLAVEVERVLQPRVSETVDEVLLPLKPQYRRKRAVALIDVSGSMNGPNIQHVAEVAYAMRGMFDLVLVFNGSIMPPRPIELRDLADVERLVNMPSDGTPLIDAMRHAIEEAKQRDAMLFVFTDEMENASKSGDVLKPDVPTIVFNAAPYPTEAVVKEVGRVVGIPVLNIDIAIAAAKLTQLMQLEQTEAIEEIARLVETEAAPHQT